MPTSRALLLSFHLRFVTLNEMTGLLEFRAIGLAVLSGLGRRRTHPRLSFVDITFLILTSTEVASGQMLDDYLLFADARCPPHHPTVLKLACLW